MGCGSYGARRGGQRAAAQGRAGGASPGGPARPAPDPAEIREARGAHRGPSRERRAGKQREARAGRRPARHTRPGRSGVSVSGQRASVPLPHCSVQVAGWSRKINPLNGQENHRHYLIYWFKDGKQISPESDHYAIQRGSDGTCSLHTEASTLDDDGNYTILAANPQGRVSCTGRLMVQAVHQRGRSPRSPSGHPHVRRPRSRSRDSGDESEPIQERFFRPHFLQAPGDLTVQEGKLCRMDCRVSGLPTPELSWQLDGKPIRPDNAHKMLVRENGVHSLIIEPVASRDAGIYTCIATSRAGQNSFSLELVVAAKEAHKPPVFIEKLQNTGVADGYPVRLECRVLGVPPPQIFWKKENESLTQSTDRVSMHQDSRGCLCLLIQGATRDDAGWYTVSAKNEAGIASCTARLDVHTQWHQPPQSTRPKKVRPSASRYAALSDQGLDIRAAFQPEANPSHLALNTGLVESEDL